MPHRKKPDLTDERAQEIAQVIETCHKAAEMLQAACEARNSLFRQLRKEGWKVKHLAELAGVTPQRMSKILDPEVTPRGGGAPPRVSRMVRDSQPWDGWV